MKIPLFPLEVVLFPEAALPLHIFEDRYKEMVGVCLAEKIGFGVVCAQREGLAVVGCTAEIEHAFRESVATFRRLSPAEAQKAKPLRIKIVTVRAGDTIEKLASRMALIDRQAERFRVLNGLEPGERLKTGEQVKIIVE